MGYKRARVLSLDDLALEIYAIAGRRGRSKFLVETAREALRRHKLLAFLERPEPAWKQSDHPDTRGESAAWVRKLHRVSGKRSQARTGQAKRVPQQP